MSGYSYPSYNGSNGGLSAYDAVFDDLFQRAWSHYNDLGQLEQALIASYSLDSTHVRSFTTLKASCNAWKEAYNQIPDNVKRSSQSEALRQIMQLLSHIDFRLQSCGVKIQELQAAQDRVRRNQFRRTFP